MASKSVLRAHVEFFQRFDPRESLCCWLGMQVDVLSSVYCPHAGLCGHSKLPRAAALVGEANNCVNFEG